MTSNAKKSAAGNTHINEGQNSPSTDTRDQIFLKALQDLILCVADPKQMNVDIDQKIPLRPEAGRLIIALRDFVSSIIASSESMTQNTIVEVSLVEDNNVHRSEDDEDGRGVSLTNHSSAKTYGSEISPQRLDPSYNPQSAFQDKLLKGLREHVFNMMPIRMLSFEGRKSSLRITLVDRGAIYARLASALQMKIHEADHVPIVRASLNKMETEQQAIDRLVSKYTRYAILSHTWLQMSREVTYSDWNKGLFNVEGPGYQKLVNFCKIAWNDHELTLGWIDTVCINKDSSSELDESIRSMYNWYHRAHVCITYLAETGTLPTMHRDRWFTRGWTLQELVAPGFIKFYNIDWKRLVNNSDNDKDDTRITAQIERATTISKKELGFIPGVPISRRMQLAATREVTREEDTAYSLMGMFDVSISTAYGEGAERAFFRLLQEILASRPDVLDIFNWAGDLPRSRPHTSRVLPSSPLHYLNSDRSVKLQKKALEPLTLTHLGLRVPVILMPAITIPGELLPYVPIGDYSASVNISPIQHSAPDATYNLLDNRISGQDGPRQNGGYQLTLAVFSFFGDAASISIMKPCIAKVLHILQDVGKATSSSSYVVIQTNMPVVFDLTNTTIENGPTKWDTINRDALTKHGMQLLNLYL